jgi:hypothetical protein
MNKPQAAKLRAIRRFLLELPEDGAQVTEFDINCVHFCAWSLVAKSKLCRDDSLYPFGAGAGGAMQRELGLDEQDCRYLFRWPDRYDEYSGSFSYEYQSPIGAAGIAEFADRVENVLQYYQSVGDL